MRVFSHLRQIRAIRSDLKTRVSQSWSVCRIRHLTVCAITPVSRCAISPALSNFELSHCRGKQSSKAIQSVRLYCSPYRTDNFRAFILQFMSRPRQTRMTWPAVSHFPTKRQLLAGSNTLFILVASEKEDNVDSSYPPARRHCEGRGWRVVRWIFGLNDSCSPISPISATPG